MACGSSSFVEVREAPDSFLWKLYFPSQSHEQRQRQTPSATFKDESLMPGQPQLFPDPEPSVLQPPSETAAGPRRAAPVWLQRLSLFVLVLFCVYLGVLVMILPWWTRIWDQNLFITSHPMLAAILHNGAVRGIISGL